MSEAPPASLPPKAVSVTQAGAPDGWTAARGFRAQVAPDGATRLVISVPSDELAAVHLRLLAALGSTVSVRYLQLTDRATGQLPKPRSFVGMELAVDVVRAAFEARPGLVWHDGRHQLWLRGSLGEQVVLDELGVIYCYPDDVAFRDALTDLPETKAVGIDGRDYVKVEFLASADAEERSLIAALNLREWEARG